VNITRNSIIKITNFYFNGNFCDGTAENFHQSHFPSEIIVMR